VAEKKIDWEKEVTGAPAPSKRTGIDWENAVTGQELRQGPRTEGWFRTEGGYARDVDDPRFGFGEHLRAGLAGDEQTKIKRYSEMSGIPEEHFGVIEGDIVFWEPELKKFVPVVAQVGEGEGFFDKYMRAGEPIAAGTGGLAPAVTGGVTGIAMGPTLASIPAAGAVAGAVNIGVQALDKYLAGEDVLTDDYDVFPAIVDAVASMGGQGLGNIMVKLANRNPLAVEMYDRLKAMDPEKIKAAEDIQRLAREEYGIELTTGQATGLNSLLVSERHTATRWPETMDVASAKRYSQNVEQVPAAIKAEVGRGTELSGEEAAQTFRGGAHKIVEQAETAAREAAKEHYRVAYAANQQMESPHLNRMLRTPAVKNALNEAVEIISNDMGRVSKIDPELTAALSEAVRLGKAEAVPGGVGRGLKLRTLDYIKQGLWITEQAAKKEGVHTPKSRSIGSLRRKFTAELDRLDETRRAGPKSFKAEGGDYARARRTFESGMEVKDEILSQGVAMLRRDKSDTVKLVNKIFNEGNVTPEEVGRMRAKFYNGGQGDAWEAGVGRWLEGALNAATKEHRQGVGNVAGTFYQKVWGTNEQKAITRAALGSDRMPGFETFLRVLNYARKLLPEASPTATDAGAMASDAFSTGVKRSLKIFNVNTYANAGDTVSAGVAALRQPGARIRLMERLFDPEGVKLLRKLRMLSPLSSRAVKLVADFMFKTGVLEIQEGLFETDVSGAPLDPDISKAWERANPPPQPVE